MQKGEYLIIKKTDFEEKIKLLKKAIEGTDAGKKAIANFINSIEANPTDLYDVVEDVFLKGWDNGSYPIETIECVMEDYLNNLEI